MPTKDSRIDAYIARSAPFAQPILRHLRRIVHAGCPAVEETIKWGMPFFMHRGMLCFMAAFKEHCAFGFPKRKLIPGAAKASGKDKDAMGQFGRLTSLADLPGRERLIDLTRQSMALIEAGVKPPRATAKKAPFTVPQDMQAALSANAAAQASFDGFPPSAQRDYVEWITEAKTEATRGKRLTQAIEWMAEGKRRNWKYERR